MLKKTLYYVPSVIVPLLINMIILVLCGRYLSPSEYGVMSLYTTTIALFYNFGLSFIQSAELRFYTDKRCEDKSVFMSTFVLANLMMTGILILIAFLIKLFIEDINVSILIFSALANALYLFCVNIERLEDKHIRYTVQRCIAAVLNLTIVLILFFVCNYMSFVSPIISMYGAYMLIALVKLFQQRKLLRLVSFSKELFKDLLTFGLPLIGVSAINSLIANSAQYMLLFYLDETSVGMYALGYKIADYSLTRITSLLLIVSTPTIIKQFDRADKLKAQNTIKQTVDIIFYISFAFIAFVLMYSNELILYVFPKFIGSEKIVQVVIVAAMFHCLSMVYCKPFELYKKTKVLMYYSIIAGTVSIIYNIIFIPIQGTIAAAYSSLISYIILVVLMLVNSRNNMDIRPAPKMLLKLFIITITTCGVALIMKILFGCESFIILNIQVAVCGVVYIGLSILNRHHENRLKKDK